MEGKRKLLVATPHPGKQVDTLKRNIFSRKPGLVGMELSEVGLFRWTNPAAHEIAEELQKSDIRIVPLFDKRMHADLEAAKIALASRADAAGLQEQPSEHSDISKHGFSMTGSQPSDAAVEIIGVAYEMEKLYRRAIKLYDEHGLQQLQELAEVLENRSLTDAIRRIKEELPALVLSTDNNRGMRMYQGLNPLYDLEFLDL